MSWTNNWSVIVALVSLATQVVEKCGLILLGISNNWRIGRQELEEHPQNVGSVQRQLAERKLAIRRHGISDKQAVASRIKVAEGLLKQEETRAGELGLNLYKWKRRVASLAFPNELSYRIKRVNDAIAEIDRALEDAIKVPPLLEEFDTWEPVKFSFQKDKRYTANKDSEDEVKTRLEGTDIVVLHGEPGSGKTCLAKHLGLDYEEKSNNWKKENPLEEPDGEKLEKPDGEKLKKPVVERPAFLDGVFFVNCGPTVEVTEVYQKLLRDLGLAGPGVANSDQQSSGTTEPPPDNGRLRKDLERGLYELSALIILDNVCDQRILDALIVPKKAGVPGRKYLVTTQNINCIPARGDLCFVKMKKMDDQAATQLLLQYLVDDNGDNLRDKFKLSGIQNLEEKMIKETNANPQALVCFAELLKGSRVLHQERWEELLDPHGEFFSTLDNEEIAKRVGHSTTVFKSMIASVKTFSREQPRALDVLLFLALCDTPVPETVLRSVSSFLDKKQDTSQETKTGKGRFPLMSWLDILENWSLIEHATWDVTKGTIPQDDSGKLRSENERKMYEVPSLRRQIILKAMREEGQSLVRKLLTTEVLDFNSDGPGEGKLVAELCAVYSDEMAKKRTLGFGGPEFETRKSFVKEAAWLLHSELEGIELSAEQKKDGKNAAKVQKQESHKYGRKVIVQVLADGTVDNEGTKRLLQLCQPFPSIVCRALKALLSDAGSSTGPRASGSDHRNSIVTQRMRGLKPTTLLGYTENMRNERKTPSTLVQLKALEVGKEYIDNAKDRGLELAHFGHFVNITPSGVEANEPESTLDALVQLLLRSEDIEYEIGKVKRILSEWSSTTNSRAKLTNGLQDLQNMKLDSAVEVVAEEVQQQVKLNPEEELLKKILENLGKTLDEGLERVARMRQISVDIVETLFKFLEEEDKKKYKSELEKLRGDWTYSAVLAQKLNELISKLEN